VNNQTAERPHGQINPSAPTQGTEIDQARGTPLNDTFGEAGDAYGRGNLEITERIVDSARSQQENFVGNPPGQNKPGAEGAGDLRGKRDEDAA
jgi:hypothetical protein